MGLLLAPRACKPLSKHKGSQAVRDGHQANDFATLSPMSLVKVGPVATASDPLPIDES